MGWRAVANGKIPAQGQQLSPEKIYEAAVYAARAFSKKLENHAHMVALYALWYNFVRIHKTPRTSPAMAAGIEKRLWSMEDVVSLIDAGSAKITGTTLVG